MNGDIVFHSCCFLGRDHDIDSNNDGDSGSDEDPDFPKEPTYYVHIFGKSELGESVHVQVKFPPFAFMEISNSWTQIQVKQFIKELPPYLKKQMSLDDCKLVYRKKFYGFTNNTDYKFIRLMFRTHKGMRNFDAYAKERGHSMYESNVDPILKLFHVQDLEASGWLRIPRGKYKQGERTTWCTHNYVCMWNDLVSLPDKTTVVPLVVASFDIEVMSVDDSFPDPDVDGNDVIQIATTLTKHGEKEPFLKHLINLGHCNPIGDDVELVCCDTEIGVLNAWRKLLIEHHVDIILGYNIWGFDLSFMYKRAVYNDPGCDFMNLGKFRDEPSVMKKTILSSAAYGHNEFQILQTPGILQIDLMHVIRKEHKLESYSLNKVSEVFLGEHKIDMPAKELFRLWRIGDPESKKMIGLYCVQDTALPAKILVKLGILSNMIEMSKATHVPMEWLLPRGQQIKCFSQILKYIRKRSMLCPATSFGERKVDKFEGATVLPPLRGAYVNDIVSCLDFASLYPSIMRAENLCHSTLVTESKFDNLEGVEYGEYKTDTKTYRFVQNIPGVLPELLEDLAKFRKKAKKEMAEAKKRGDDFMYNVYNGKQLAYKVSMNSVYGFTGAANGFLPCVPIASAVTATGRKMIEHTKEMVEREYPGSQVIYGDSVMPYTPITYKSDGNIYVNTIDNIKGDWEEYTQFKYHDTDRTNKEQIINPNIKVWTHNGWSNVKRVIRHKTTKKIFRILTHTGLVDVTEDHSLLDENVNIVKPVDIFIGGNLLHSQPILDGLTPTGNISIGEAFIYGMFVGDGCCGIFGPKQRPVWKISNSDLNLLVKCKSLLEEIYKNDFVIYDTMKSSGVYTLSPRNGDVKNATRILVGKYRCMCYIDKSKTIPHEILNGTLENMESFLEGLVASDGNRKEHAKMGCLRIDTKNQVSAQSYVLLLQRLGYKTGLNTRTDKPNIFRIGYTKAKQRKNPNGIKKIHVLHEAYDGYVYDIETENGVFHAGVGNMIVKNTDSVFCRFGKHLDMHETFKIAEEAAQLVTKTFKHPNELEFEKCYSPLLLFAKKRYSGLMYTKPDKSDYLDSKGIQLVRRDNCPLVKTISKGILDKIMYEKDIDGAMEFAREQLRLVMSGKVDIKEFILSKTLRVGYKNDNLPHLQVARKIEDRNGPGSGPKSGERVPFVFVQTKGKKDLGSTKAEDPAYVTEQGLKIDLLYYLKHQLESPVVSLFELIVDDPYKVIIEEIEKEYTKSDTYIESVNKMNKQTNITSFFGVKK